MYFISESKKSKWFYQFFKRIIPNDLYDKKNLMAYYFKIKILNIKYFYL